MKKATRQLLEIIYLKGNNLLLSSERQSWGVALCSYKASQSGQGPVFCPYYCQNDEQTSEWEQQP